MTFARPTADQINDHLKSGGIVQVATHLKAITYDERHAGMFSEGKDGCLYVARRKHKDCLSTGQRLLVAIRMGRYV